MKKLLIIVFALAMTGCASFAQVGSVEKAYEEYEAKDYQATLEHITRAENIKETSPELNAELSYLKAQTYEQLGQPDKATTLYQYIKEQHANTEYGYLAAEKLKKPE